MDAYTLYFGTGAVLSAGYTAGVLIAGRVDREWRGWDGAQRVGFVLETARCTFLNFMVWPLAIIGVSLELRGRKAGGA